MSPSPHFSGGECLDLEAVPLSGVEEFRDRLLLSISGGGRLASFFAFEIRPGETRLLAIIAWEVRGMLEAQSCRPGVSFPSLTPLCPQAHLFEREIFEQTGIRPEGHPALKPVRFPPARALGGIPPVIGAAEFFRLEGGDVHEVAVGPVHAGVIEPGHFRFQCRGETVHHLEISLGYQHRGVERALRGGPDLRSRHLVETAAGDTSIGHVLAYTHLLESAGKISVPLRAQALRGIALELERCANHTGDLGALAGDVGYLPTLSYCGRIRGDFLNMTALLCGNRFGRGLVVPGSTGFDPGADTLAELRRRLRLAREDFTRGAGLLWDEPSVMARFEGTGTVSMEDAQALGLVGPAARAAGCLRDVRQDFPSGIHRFSHIPVITDRAGDVRARAWVRYQEVLQALDFMESTLNSLPPAGPVAPGAVIVPALPPNSLTVSLVEGWRGEIVHTAITDTRGRFLAYHVVDPSFHNWEGLALCLRGQEISDFPLCNKSFNLSYCGHDL